MIVEFLILVVIITTAAFLSEITPLAQHNWYNNMVFRLMTNTKSPRISNLYYRVLMSKIFTCERCHYHHWILVLTSITMYITGNYFWNPIIEALPISLLMWYTYDK